MKKNMLRSVTILMFVSASMAFTNSNPLNKDAKQIKDSINSKKIDSLKMRISIILTNPVKKKKPGKNILISTPQISH
jgi:hypothetical protein